MIRKETKAGQKVREHLVNFIQDTATGDLAFCLVMRHPEQKKLLLHDRHNQPCYGDLRKYKDSHPDYTNPKPDDDYHPDDLLNPFPAGTPEALALPFYLEVSGYLVELTEFLFSSESPWRKGIGSDIEFIRDDEELKGVILYDTEFDPTVLVNLMNCHRSLHLIQRPTVSEVLKKTDPLTATLTILGVGNLSYPLFNTTNQIGYGGSVDYYTPTRWNLKRFKDGNPHDLTGGSFRDRFDYNRKILHEIFGKGYDDSTETLVNLMEEVRSQLAIPHEFGSHRKVSLEEITEAVQSILKEV